MDVVITVITRLHVVITNLLTNHRGLSSSIWNLSFVRLCVHSCAYRISTQKFVVNNVSMYLIVKYLLVILKCCVWSRRERTFDLVLCHEFSVSTSDTNANQSLINK